MGSNELKNRDNWQAESTQGASSKEKQFIYVFEKHFKNTEFCIIEKPDDFKSVYSDVSLDEKTISRIYNPPKIGTWGFTPDFKILNTSNNKSIFGDNKKQDGWVEGLTQNAGRGNAHERMGRYFSTGILQCLREKSNLKENVLPFWIVLEGNITRDPKRVREITCWFGNDKDHFYMWDTSPNSELLILHFEEKIKPFLI